MTDLKPVSLVIEMRVDFPAFDPGFFGENGDPEYMAGLLAHLITSFSDRRGGMAVGEVRVEGEQTREEKYVAEGGEKCPVCSNYSFDPEEFVHEENDVFRRVYCSACDSMWVETFNLFHMDIVTHGTAT